MSNNTMDLFKRTAESLLAKVEKLKVELESTKHFAYGIVDAAGQPYLKNLPIAEDRASLDMLVSYINDMPPQPGSKYEKPFEVVPLSWNKEGK